MTTRHRFNPPLGNQTGNRTVYLNGLCVRRSQYRPLRFGNALVRGIFLSPIILTLEETRDGINEAINSLQRRITEIRNATKDQE